MQAKLAGILGREQELAAIQAFMAHGAAGPSALVLEGEAGIGKTALWRSGVAYARERGLALLMSSPSGGETQLSFSALVDLLGAVAKSVLASLPSPQRHALEVALRMNVAAETAPDELTIAAATLGAIRALAQRGPVLIAIDDVQWLDGPSAAALTYAARRLDDSPVSLLIGRRLREPRTQTQPFDDALAALEVLTIRLGPLSATALRDLIRERLCISLPPSVVGRVEEMSGGNPFYALELARALGRRAEPIDPASPLPVPDSLHDLVHERLAILSAETKDLLAVVAALSEPTLAAVEAAGAAEAVDDAVRAGVLVTDGERLRFAHPLLASGAYSLLGPRARRALHRRLAEVVGQEEERARHMALGADGPSAEVAEVLHEAARQAAARGAIGTAADLAEKAVRLTPTGLDDELAARRLDAATYQFRHGDMAQARANAEPLLADGGPTQIRTAALLRLARLSSELSLEQALDLCEQAIREADTDSLEAEARQLAAELWMRRGHIPQALRHARVAADLAERAGATALLVESLGTLCHYETYTGEITPGRLERAVELEQSAPRQSHAYSPREILGLRLMYADRLDEARKLLEASLVAAAEIGDELDRWSLLMHLTQLECRAGRLAGAVEHAREQLTIAEQAGSSWLIGVTEFTSALTAAHLGHVREAREAGTKGAAWAAESGDELFRVLSLRALGFLELSLGDGATANRHLGPLPEQLERMGYINPGVHPGYADAIEARIACGDLDVDLEIERLESRGRALDYPWALAVAARCRGLLLAARGELSAAIAELERGLLEHERSPQPLERGRTLLVLGATLRRAKQRGEARARLTEALELFDALGAALWAERAAAELARVSGRPRGSGQLTETERRVAELVAEGLSNKEVAARLFVSVRAVEANLSKVYAKLGIRSRTQLAGRL